mmetsp:Transcript_2009/g.5983  ORF Transcript_2009/g.5983 Transcript_2009/m.5983 type:complete len:158 (+) Transcript_2009:166-639(+)
MGRPAAIGGPCSHCHVRQSPCWRKGPSDGLNGKKTLCNACGSRYLTKGAAGLQGYLPGLKSRLSVVSKPVHRKRASLQYQHAILTSLTDGRPKDELMEGSHTAAVPPLYKAPPPTPPSPALSTDSQDSSPATFAIPLLTVSMRRRPRKQLSPAIAAG